MKYPLLLIILFASCWQNRERRVIEDIPTDTNTTFFNPLPVEDTTYMPTGFYFVSDDSTVGVRKRVDKSEEVYRISKAAFASVNNVIGCELKANINGKDTYHELCLTFDFIGAKNLEKGLRDSRHKKIAAVVANRLLYVVDNAPNEIATGNMCLSLSGYSDEEMQLMKNEVDHKR